MLSAIEVNFNIITDFALTVWLGIHRLTVSAVRYVGEYLDGKQGPPGPLIGNGPLAVIIFSGLYIMVAAISSVRTVTETSTTRYRKANAKISFSNLRGLTFRNAKNAEMNAPFADFGAAGERGDDGMGAGVEEDDARDKLTKNHRDIQSVVRSMAFFHRLYGTLCEFKAYAKQ